MINSSRGAYRIGHRPMSPPCHRYGDKGRGGYVVFLSRLKLTARASFCFRGCDIAGRRCG